MPFSTLELSLNFHAVFLQHLIYGLFNLFVFWRKAQCPSDWMILALLGLQQLRHPDIRSVLDDKAAYHHV